MYPLILSLVRSSTARSLVAFAVFCACFLFSCAVGEETKIPTDAAPVLDVKIDVKSNAPPTFDVLSFDLTVLDAPVTHDEDHAIMSRDVTSMNDVQPDQILPVSDGGTLDAAVMSQSDISSQFPTQDAIMIDVVSHPLEICNGRDDDGNGFIDELFECSVGRRGDTCVTTCGANGYRLCDSACRWNPVCATYPEDCSDTIDNDCNGQIDCADTACASVASCHTPPPMPDAGMPRADVISMPFCHELVIRQRSSAMPLCRTGWVYILYDFDGHPHESSPSGPITYTICGRLQGQLVVSARCDGDYLLDWPGTIGTPVNRSGIASITLDGIELADSEALLCLDRWSRTPGVRPVVPLEPYFYGRCP